MSWPFDRSCVFCNREADLFEDLPEVGHVLLGQEGEFECNNCGGVWRFVVVIPRGPNRSKLRSAGETT